MKRLVVLISGNGSNLQAIIDATKNSTLPQTEIVQVISNKPNAYGLERAKQAEIPVHVMQLKKQEKRVDYDTRLAAHVTSLSPDLIILAGWMRILTNRFLGDFSEGQVINLHPALPGEFPGADGVGDAFRAYKKGLIDHTGLMVHEVVEQIDAGKVLETVKVEILESDTLESLKERVQSREKLALINAIYKKLYCVNFPRPLKVYKGKVRQMHHLGYNVVAMEHSDRLSAFDRAICDIPGKGRVLLEISKWWFHNTKFIVDNHYLESQSNVMFVKECKPIPLEIVIRDYITGSTNTSLWQNYEKGVRNYCGNVIPEGLLKNQKLPNTIVTPTTKGESDEPISPEEIVKRGILSETEWKKVEATARELFRYGTYVASKKGLILVDTKYEFGWYNGELTLIDEVHTPDSSRYWIEDTYQTKFEAGQEPDKIDKDQIRDYLKSKFDPYTSAEVPEIPHELKTAVFNGYSLLLEKLTGESINQESFRVYQEFDIVLENYWNEQHSPTIVIASDLEHKRFIGDFQEEAKKHNLYTRSCVFDIYKNPNSLLHLIEKQNQKSRIIWISLDFVIGKFLETNSVHPVLFANYPNTQLGYLQNLMAFCKKTFKN